MKRNRTVKGQGERRVAHVVEDLDPAGIVPWLLEFAAEQMRMAWEVDICVVDRKRGALAAAFEASGCRILRCSPGLGALLPVRMWRLLAKRGPYRAVHLHLGGARRRITRLGLCLAGAWLAGVRVRALHLHTAPEEVRNPAGTILARKFATVAIAPSRRLIGEWACLTTDSGLPAAEANYGVALAPERVKAPGKISSRPELGIPGGATVVGMIAREGGELSSAGFLRIAEEVLRIVPQAKFVLAGEREMRRWFAGQVRIMGLDDRALFVNRPANPQEIPAGLFDVLLVAEPKGEPPLLLLKAQAAGLLAVVCGEVEPRYVVLPQSVARVAAGSGLEGWAAAVVSLAGKERLSQVAASNLVAARGFEAADACRRVLAIYEEGIGPREGLGVTVPLSGGAANKAAGEWYA